MTHVISLRRSIQTALGTAVVAGLALSGAASAEDKDVGGLETIVVTAQKESQNVQQVPISVTAITAEGLEKQHTVNIEALTGSVPNVQIGHFSNTPTGAVFNIRGMGVIEPDPYAGQTVTIVVDGVPQVFNMTSLPDLFDIDRIEVLRGPQGTLFGANTTGGVVNIVTRQPTGQVEGRMMASIGNYDRVDADAAFDFPLSDTLAGKVSVLHHSEKGYVTNIVDGKSLGDQNISGIRGYLKWTPNSDFNATLIEEVVQAHNGSPIVIAGDLPGEAEYVAAGTMVPGALLPMYQSPCAVPNAPCVAPDHYYSASTVTDKDDYSTYATTLTANWKSPIGDLVSITGYKRFQEDNYTDQDGTPVFLDATRRTTHGYQVTEELRDTIHPTDTTRLMFGGYLSYDYYHHIQNFLVQFAFPGFSQVTEQDQIRRSSSLFAQGYWDVTPKLSISLGGRFTSEKTRMEVTDNNYLCPAPEGGGSALAQFYGCPIVTSGPFLGYGVFRAPSKQWNNAGGKLGIDYKFTDKIMAYGYIAHGFKSGGFTGRISLKTSIGPYNPEYVNTAEVGLKADWFDNRLRTNVAVFYNKYKDLQIAEIYFLEVGGALVNDNQILNAANATTKGVEFELTAVPVTGLKINLAAAYLSAKYSEFNYPLSVDQETHVVTYLNLAGTSLQNAPKVTASAGVNYEVPVGQGTVSFGVQDRYTGEKYFTNILDTPRSKIQATNYIDVNADWSPKGDNKLSFSAWCRNVGDKHYIASVFDAPGTLGLTNYAPPREFGLTVNYGW